MTISDPRDPQLRQVPLLRTRKGRERSGLFAVEGEDLVAAAQAAGREPVALFAARGSGLPGTPVEPEVLDGVSALGSGTRTIGVYEQAWGTPAGPLAMALWGVGDPGNVGTVARSALAFGASSLLLGPGCADPYGPKAARASMGAIFSLVPARVETVEEMPGTVVALAAREGEPLAGEGWPEGEITLLVGGERQGLPPQVAAQAGQLRHIPIEGDSLNAAIAASIALYAASGRV
ncbi:MAG: TrmH family RNA methyltransferase [Solirubrobacterales bacterium]